MEAQEALAAPEVPADAAACGMRDHGNSVNYDGKHGGSMYDGSMHDDTPDEGAVEGADVADAVAHRADEEAGADEVVPVLRR